MVIIVKRHLHHLPLCNVFTTPTPSISASHKNYRLLSARRDTRSKNVRSHNGTGHDRLAFSHTCLLAYHHPVITPSKTPATKLHYLSCHPSTPLNHHRSHPPPHHLHPSHTPLPPPRTPPYILTFPSTIPIPQSHHSTSTSTSSHMETRHEPQTPQHYLTRLSLTHMQSVPSCKAFPSVYPPRYMACLMFDIRAGLCSFSRHARRVCPEGWKVRKRSGYV